MEVVFLGTGGGRFNLVRQIRMTGGWRINGSLSIHVDPGPGALSSSLRFSQDAGKLDLIIITHNHIDHTNDAGLLAEALGQYGKRKGFAIGSASVINGDKNGDRGISKYHQKSLVKCRIALPGKKIALKMHGKRLLIMPTKVRHDDKTGFGFVLQMDGRKIGYTSDTEYFRGIGRQYRGCDVLIANCLKPAHDMIPGHLDSGSTAKLLVEAAPSLAILTHLGTGMLSAGPHKEAAKVEKESGVRTVAAFDGMKLRLKKSRRKDRKA